MSTTCPSESGVALREVAQMAYSGDAAAQYRCARGGPRGRIARRWSRTRARRCSSRTEKRSPAAALPASRPPPPPPPAEGRAPGLAAAAAAAAAARASVPASRALPRPLPPPYPFPATVTSEQTTQNIFVWALAVRVFRVQQIFILSRKSVHKAQDKRKEKGTMIWEFKKRERPYL